MVARSSRLLPTVRAALLGVTVLLCASAGTAQAQQMVRYTDADGMQHMRVEADEGNKDGSKDGNSRKPRTIVYRYTDADGAVHFYAQTLDDPDKLMASSASLLNHPGSKEAITPADPPFVRTMLAHRDARKYDSLLSEAAGEFGLDAALLKAVMTAESGFNAGAVSSKGAIGLMQIMPDTAERYGLQGDRRKSLHQKLVDPKINIRLAARYLRDLMGMFPQHVELAIASYNAGEGTVQKYGNKIPPYPETQGYVRLVSRFYELYRPPGAMRVAAGERSPGQAHLKVTLPPREPATAND
ncbi:lytic transglycosylase domain-containing protein [Herbaspirillum sp. AP02]|uniref:lytic transglycosylase domain-containing protein n=1 Tax=unclassified Herbaspirillum TaxID=2624150 RepID=UPI0015DAB981|nr:MULTISPECIES: lytic transglycosylase domain-containing protein [unclassified Herbaspirillum]MBG7618631.1 lytic transglycosylase domain-containing protein [Herbaspirillum sp. AP02]NZD67567.1 lytic transglycosylase domain-containing protein [Herbaspirillum sp. AP21]